MPPPPCNASSNIILFSYPGKGLFTTESIEQGEYIGEYKGQHLTEQELDTFDDAYDDTFLYTFKHDGKWCGLVC